jgi:hypothetical protein
MGVIKSVKDITNTDSQDTLVYREREYLLLKLQKDVQSLAIKR